MSRIITPSSGQLIISRHKHVFRLWLAWFAPLSNAFGRTSNQVPGQRPLSPAPWLNETIILNGAPAARFFPLPLHTASRIRHCECLLIFPLPKSSDTLAWVGQEWGSEARWLAAARTHFPFPVWVYARAGGVTERAMVITVCFCGGLQHHPYTKIGWATCVCICTILHSKSIKF